MPPKTDREYKYTSFTGLPSDLIDAIREEADRQDVYLHEIFREAIEDLASVMESMTPEQQYDWPLARPKTGSTPYNARMEVDVVETLRAVSDKHGIKKNILFMAALRDYLRKRGRQVQI
jgi:hypothetical protein